MRVLITGAAGMLGQDVRLAAAEAGHEVVALTRADLDITDAGAVMAAFGRHAPDAVINCAAYAKVDLAEDDPDGAARVNVDGPAALARATAACGVWLVHVSTDYVFSGDARRGPYVESDPTGPVSVYGATKLAGENAVAALAGLAHTIVRTAWLFGTAGPCFPATILRAAASRPELSVVNDQVGCPTYTGHLASALVKLAERRDLSGVVHVAGGGECSWFDFASATLAAVPDAPDARVVPCTSAQYPTRAPRPAYSVLASERADAPRLPEWQVGLSDYIAARSAAQEDGR